MPEHGDLGFQLRLRPKRCRQCMKEQPEEVEHCGATLAHPVVQSSPDEVFGRDSQQMVDEIDAMLATHAVIGMARLSPRVRAAMTEVPRHEFVPLEQRSAAYRNRSLPIGHGQTISQPLVVALMTD